MKTSKFFFFLGLLTIVTASIDAMRTRVAQRFAQKFVLGMTGITGASGQANSWAPTRAQAPGSTTLNSGTLGTMPASIPTSSPAGSRGAITAVPSNAPVSVQTAAGVQVGPQMHGPKTIWEAITGGIGKALDMQATPQFRKQQMDLILTGGSTYPDRYHNPNAWRGGPRDLPDTKDRLFQGVDGGILGEQGPIRRNMPYGTSESSGSFCTIQ